jgi:hypothetical protein
MGRAQPQLQPQLWAVPAPETSAEVVDLLEHLVAKHPRLLALLENDFAEQGGAQVEDPAAISEGQLFVTTEQLARRYGVEPRWIRTRAAKLGGVRLSDASNSKLRYDIRIADAYMDSQRLEPKRTGQRRKPTPTQRHRATSDLIPFV